MEIFSQILGWVGTFLVVLAYFVLVYREEITEHSKSYQLLNLFGAILIGVSVFYKTAWPAFALQIIWALIAIYSLLKIKFKKK